jgi:hypothetical protein
MSTEPIKILVRGAYQIQKLRMQMGNRICAQWKVRMGQEPGESEDEMPEENRGVLEELRTEFARLTDGLVSSRMPGQAKLGASKLISSATEFALVEQYIEMEKTEARHFSRLGAALKGIPIWDGFLLGVKGVGPAMAGVIVSEIDIHKAKYASSLWAYAGLDVAADGKGRSRKKEHLVESAYKDKDGNEAKRMGITFNPFLKTKLTGVLADIFIKLRCEPYRSAYDGYKNRLVNHPRWMLTTPGHRNNAAKRYMIKLFLVDLYVAWRTLEGLEVHPPYAEAKLGIVHTERKAA